MKSRLFELNWPLALVLLLPLWCAGLFLRNYWTPDEPREADIIWRMAQQADRTLPHLAEEPFMEKPPLSYWLGADAQRVAGSSPAVTRVPNLLYALLSCIAVGLLALHMAGQRAAFIATLVFGSMFEVYRVAIWLAPDASLVSGCAIALLGAYRGYAATKSRDQLWWYTLMHAGALMGFMAKSAPGWLVPALALIVLIVMERRWQEIWNWRLWAGLSLQILVIGAWVMNMLAQPEGVTALKVMFWNNLAGRFTEIDPAGAFDYASAHQNWMGKYLVESPYYLFPWSLAVVAALWMAWSRARGADGRPWRFAVACSIPFAVLLSLATTARDVYFAPACVGLALLVALWLEALLRSRALARDAVRGVDAWALRITRWLALAFAALALVLLTIVAHQVEEYRVPCLAGVFGVVMLSTLLIGHAAATHDPWQTTMASFSVYGGSLLIVALCLSPLFNRIQDLPGVAAAIHHDTVDQELAIIRPDETTIAMMDYEVGRKVKLIEGSDEQLVEQSRTWLQGDPQRRRIVVKLPGSGAGPLSKIIKPSSRDRDEGLAALLQQAGVAQVVQRYELPHGRRFALMASVD